ncbi:NAD(P)-dependent oxidoreductase [Candidatus Woesearchaeota archaeon]|nr:NAD(P)-dependent oxidoreductase [Candidatus Woesearchaeota archaeon]
MVEEYFKDKNVLITGGLGFIGSNIAHRLARLKPSPKKITIVDSCIKGLGANVFNIKGIEHAIEEMYLGQNCDLRNTSKIERLVSGIDCIFNLAGSVSHSGSEEDPECDRAINYDSHQSLIKACKLAAKETNRQIKIVFAGTRDQYGKVPKDKLPVDESQIVLETTDPQGIHKYMAELFHLHNNKQGLETVSLRLTNIYGPRQQMVDPSRGFVPWYIRQAIDNKPLEIWGNGKFLRDIVFVDDAVSAFMLAMSSPITSGKAYNVGSFIRYDAILEDKCNNVVHVSDVANMVVDIAERGFIEYKEYPENKKLLEPGDFCANATKLYNDVGWHPKIGPKEGLRRTIDFYRKNKVYYW